MLRRFPHTAAVLIVALILSACATDQDPTELVTADIAALPTTAPISVPVEPTPTPLGLPAIQVPLNTPVPEQPTPVPTEVPPEPTAVPPTAVPATPEPTAAVAAPTAEPTAAPTTEPTPEPTIVPTPEPTAAAAPAAASDRSVTEVGYRPLGRAASVGLSLPVALIEMIGFHEASHPGAQAINAAGTGVEMITLASRSRGTAERSAADIVVPPGEPVVAPATGTIVAANPYILYCQHDDRLVYIEPDGLPGWQVRVFHVVGEGPPVGTRVIAGVTPIATGARLLPFESQVDEFTGEPSWPHVHVEVVDTTVPDTRPPGPGCP